MYHWEENTFEHEGFNVKVNICLHALFFDLWVRSDHQYIWRCCCNYLTGVSLEVDFIWSINTQHPINSPFFPYKDRFLFKAEADEHSLAPLFMQFSDFFFLLPRNVVEHGEGPFPW